MADERNAKSTCADLVANVYRCPADSAFEGELLVDGELVNRDDFEDQHQSYGLELVARAIDERPETCVASGEYWGTYVEGALDPDPEEPTAILRVSWNPSQEPSTMIVKLATASVRSLVKAVKDELYGMASEMEDLAGTGEPIRRKDIEVDVTRGSREGKRR